MTDVIKTQADTSEGAEVSSTPYLDPERRKALGLTEEPQAGTSLGGHQVPNPGHLRVLSAPGVGERDGDGKPGENTADFEPTPPDAPGSGEVVAGGGTVGPKGQAEGAPTGTGTADASTVAEEYRNAEVTEAKTEAPEGTSSTPVTTDDGTEAPAPEKKAAPRKRAAKKSAGARAGAKSTAKGN